MAPRKRSTVTIGPGDPAGDPPPAGEQPVVIAPQNTDDEPEDSGPFAYQVQALRAYADTGDLGVLSDARFADWSWHIFRLRGADELPSRESGANPRIWCDKQVGPLDLSLIQSRHGGGVYEIWCKDPDNVLRRKLRQEIAGPRKVYAPMAAAAATPAPAPAPAPAANSTALDMLARAIERQGQLLEQLVRQPKGQSAVEVLEMASRISSMTNPRPQESASDVLSVLKEGMALQAQIAGGGEASTAEKLLERALPTLERLLGQMLAPRRGPGPKPAAPRPTGEAVPTSSATVVEDPKPGEGEPVAENHRMSTAVEACAKSLATGQAPEDFAVTLENILNEQELGLLRMAGPDMLLGQMRAHAGGRFPVLEHENALPFVTAVLAELNAPPET